MIDDKKSLVAEKYPLKIHSLATIIFIKNSWDIDYNISLTNHIDLQ